MNIILLLCIVIHLLSCGLWFFIRKVPKNEIIVLLPLALFIPVIGIICLAVSSRPVHEERETPVSQMYRLNEKDSMPSTAGRQELDTVLPFDEVLQLNNDKSRREVMMHFLRRDPFMYLEMLKVAKVSSDVEITHYATTTIMEIQRDLDISMQNTEKAYNTFPDDLDTVNRFIAALSSYIDTGLLLENRMVQLRQQLSSVLEHKLSIFPNSRSAHLQLVENEIRLGNYEHAGEVAADMCEKWPADEESWLKSLHVCMVSGNAKEKMLITEKLKIAIINWTKSGREEADFLCG